jgi:hypothetical protein
VGKVNYVAIKKAIRDMLLAQTGQGLSLEGVQVYYGKRNADSDKCPMVALYSGSRKEESKTTMRSQVTVTFFLDVVAWSMESMEASDDKLQNLLDNVESIFRGNPRIGNTVLYTEIPDAKFDEDTSTGYFSGCQLTIQCTLNV